MAPDQTIQKFSVPSLIPSFPFVIAGEVSVISMTLGPEDLASNPSSGVFFSQTKGSIISGLRVRGRIQTEEEGRRQESSRPDTRNVG